jgi:tryptophan synthase alpha chain
MTTGRERIREAFATARAGDRALLMPYLTAGLPRPDVSAGLFVTMAEAGADAFEIGIPYSDPLMDGPTVHEAGLRALAAGATFQSSLDTVQEVTDRTGKPVLVMTYANPILRRGVDEFCRRVALAGASGLIVADLPVDESASFSDAATDAGLGLALFAAPTTDGERLARIVSADPVFVYAVARLGVTGEQLGGESQLATLAGRIRERTDLPIVAGVGIADVAMAKAAAAVADGVIVGSALVRRVLDAEDDAEARASLATGVAELAAVMRH